MANKVLIANRGEIAVRIIRACKELGLPCVAVYSDVDQDSLHVRLADEAICIGGANSYLHMNNIISAAIATGCNAIHPGYGFLAENSKFASLVEQCHLTFIGPSSQVIELLGNKVNAKAIAKKCGIPTIADSEGSVDSIEEAICEASRIGYPILIKATFGGGGRGITLVHDDNELISEFNRARFEVEKSFGSPEVYLEKYIANPRHVEIQIMADQKGNIVTFPERDCSMQRRHQKLIEESPSPIVGEELRTILCNQATKLAREVGYTNCGTVEFLLDRNNHYYFMEVNPRIQVEHPITEAITGIDIVKTQIQLAYGQRLSLTQKDISIKGVAIECRLNAEDPDHDFRPSPGTIRNIIIPGGMGVRIDTHLYAGSEILPFYDSLIAKVIVHAPTRLEAIRKMRVALEQFMIDGPKTNIETLYLVMYNTDYVKGIYDTNFVNNFTEIVKANKHE